MAIQCIRLSLIGHRLSRLGDRAVGLSQGDWVIEGDRAIGNDRAISIELFASLVIGAHPKSPGVDPMCLDANRMEWLQAYAVERNPRADKLGFALPHRRWPIGDRAIGHPAIAVVASRQ
jgi:hypothetical protein